MPCVSEGQFHEKYNNPKKHLFFHFLIMSQQTAIYTLNILSAFHSATQASFIGTWGPMCIAVYALVPSFSLSLSHTHTCTRARSHTHTHTHRHTSMWMQTHMNTQAHTLTPAHTLMRTCGVCLNAKSLLFVTGAITKGLLSWTQKSLGEIGSSIEGLRYWFWPLAQSRKRWIDFFEMHSAWEYKDYCVFSLRNKLFHDISRATFLASSCLLLLKGECWQGGAHSSVVPDYPHLIEAFIES